MPRFVALLRGVNVGGARRVPMADLKRLLAALGYTHIVTVLNSGNAVFHAASGLPAAQASRIAAAIAAQLKIDVPVVVKSAKELTAIAAGNPWSAQDINPSRLLVAFVPDAVALRRLAAIEALVKPPERFALGRHAAYLYCPPGIATSKAWQALLGTAGKAATTRNWATVLKLQRLASAPPQR